MKIRISGTVNDSIVDGPGLRYALFTQGCPHGCPGCHNPETHDAQGGREADTDDLLDVVRKNPLLSGITLSGGEPFAQCAPCIHMAREARRMGLTVWAYTGYTYDELARGTPQMRKLLGLCDVLVDGRFEIGQRSLTLPFRGSHNQRIIDVPASQAAGRVVLHERHGAHHGDENTGGPV